MAIYWVKSGKSIEQGAVGGGKRKNTLANSSAAIFVKHASYLRRQIALLLQIDSWFVGSV
jgi:hypothetical protein